MTAEPTQPAAPRRSRSVMIAALAVGVVMLLLVVLLITRKNADDRSTASALIGGAVGVVMVGQWLSRRHKAAAQEQAAP